MLLNTHLLDLSWSVSFSSSAMKCSLGSRGGFPSCEGTHTFSKLRFLLCGTVLPLLVAHHLPFASPKFNKASYNPSQCHFSGAIPQHSGD